MNWSCKLTLGQRKRDGGGGQPPVKSEYLPELVETEEHMSPLGSSPMLGFQ